jgi:hypothetical protein
MRVKSPRPSVNYFRDNATESRTMKGANRVAPPSSHLEERQSTHRSTQGWSLSPRPEIHPKHMVIWDHVTRADVLRAIEEYDRLGAGAVLL